MTTTTTMVMIAICVVVSFERIFAWWITFSCKSSPAPDFEYIRYIYCNL